MSYTEPGQVSEETIRERQTERSYAQRALRSQISSAYRALKEIELSQFAAEVHLAYPEVAFIQFGVDDSWGDIILESRIEVLDSRKKPIKEEDTAIRRAIFEMLDVYDRSMLIGYLNRLLAIEELALRKGSEFANEF